MFDRIISFVPNRSFYFVVVFLVSLSLILALPITAFAQDTGSPIIPPDVMSPEQALTLLLSTVLAIGSTFVGGALNTAIVNVLKPFVPIPADTLKNYTGLGLVILYWIAFRFGAVGTFESVGQFLTVLLPALINLIGTPAASSAIHAFAVRYKLYPVLSYQRTVPKLE